MVFGAGVDFQRAFGRLGTDADIGQRHRHQQQRGEDQHGDTDTGGDRQVLDHRNVDQHQHRKAHGIGQQRGQSGQEQPAKGIARGDQLVSAATDVLHDPVHFLRTVGHANGEHQKRHQNRKRIERVTEQSDQTQLPDHRNHRTQNHQCSAAHATGEGIDDRGGDQRRGTEVHHDQQQTIDQVAHQFGETDDADFDRALALFARLVFRAAVGKLELVTQLFFERARKAVIVDGGSRDRILLQ
ncbi:hypothetical protein D3C86_1482520 [compost metagenome]